MGPVLELTQTLPCIKFDSKVSFLPHVIIIY
jgi:hypothetical protein